LLSYTISGMQLQARTVGTANLPGRPIGPASPSSRGTRTRTPTVKSRAADQQRSPARRSLLAASRPLSQARVACGCRPPQPSTRTPVSLSAARSGWKGSSSESAR
jgi:transposase